MVYLQIIPYPQDATPADVYVCYLLELLKQNRINDAQACSQRIALPVHVRSHNPELAAVLATVFCMRDRHYQAIHQSFRTLKQTLKPVLNPLREGLENAFVNRQLLLIEKAYSCINMEDASAMLGLDVDSIRKGVQVWTVARMEIRRLITDDLAYKHRVVHGNVCRSANEIESQKIVRVRCSSGDLVVERKGAACQKSSPSADIFVKHQLDDHVG
eukprot:CFRG5053T1